MSEGRIFAWTDLQSVHKEIEKICYRISNANIQRVQSVRIAKSKRSDCKSERTVEQY